MSRANVLARRYHLLEAGERFQAALEAGARDDDEERRRLVDSCPMRSARITDPAYMDRIATSRDLAVAVALELTPRMAQVRLLEATRELVGPALMMGAEPERGDEAPLIRAFSEAETEIRELAAAVFEAFSVVCRRELGLEPEVVLAAHLGSLHIELLGLNELDGAKPDKAALARWRKVLGCRWRDTVGK